MRDEFEMCIIYQKLKDFLPNYQDWFERIKEYSLEYEVTRMFISYYRQTYGEYFRLDGKDPYIIVEMLRDAMFEWDI